MPIILHISTELTMSIILGIETPLSMPMILSIYTLVHAYVTDYKDAYHNAYTPFYIDTLFMLKLLAM
jgi:hypothetical protein